MSKRRRTSSIGSSKDGESLDGTGNGDSGGNSVRKRRKKQDPMELVQQVYDSIRQHRKEDGSLLCDAFIRIPKRRQAPLYYELVRHPLDLLRVQQKLKTDEYGDIDDLQADIELIVSNAKQFHRKTSLEYRDACDLLALFYLNKTKIIDGIKQPSNAERVSTVSIRPSRTGSNSAKIVGRRSLSALLQQRQQQQRRGRASRGKSVIAMRSRRSLSNNHAANYHRYNNHNSRKQIVYVDDDDDEEEEEDEGDDSNDDDGEGRPKQRQSARSRLHSLPPDSTSSTSSTTATDEVKPYSNAYEELFTTIMTATDMDGEPLHTDFQLLPSRRKYPKYYEFIDTPIDLRMIARKIQSHSYRSLNEMERDVHTLTRNACVFNEPGSHIYRCAKLLRRAVHQKRMEMENSVGRRWGKVMNTIGGSVIEGRSERIRNRSRGIAGGMSLSAITAALKDDEEEDDAVVDQNDEDIEEEEESDDDNQDQSAENCMDYPDDSDGSTIGNVSSSNSTNTSGALQNSPKWKLFEAVRSMRSQGGSVLSEPFWRLPSRRFYPDYYRKIKNPVSLTQIRRKLTRHLYGTVSEVAGDLTVLFENAKRYNDDSSKLYKDAVKLQRIMQLKLQELLDIDQNFDTDLEQPEYKKRGPKPKQAQQNATPPRGRPPKDVSRLQQDSTSKSPQDNHILLRKKRLHSIAKYLLDYKKPDGRQPLLAFVEKPSKKLYPDYYEVIREPIDFLDIEARIKANRYPSEADMVRDFRLMFSNCRTYNETNSPLYEDACLLEKVLAERCSVKDGTDSKTSVAVHSSPIQVRDINRVRKGRRILSPGARRCKSLYDTIHEYREPKANRQLSTIFLKLPSKSDYPDYYEVISRPIDLERIGHKARMGKYHEVDEICADLVLMFDNACKFNEPDSQVYKDALVLHQLTLQQKRKVKQSDMCGVGGDGAAVPDVQSAIQDILLDLFTSVYNHQDDEERCYSDSLAELPEHDLSPINSIKRMRGVSLDLIKRRLDCGLYQRLDTFQADVFACLERARRLSRTDSQIFEDAVELQRFFIRRRDEVCKEGHVLRSPGLRYTLQRLHEHIEEISREKRKTEQVEVEEEVEAEQHDADDNDEDNDDDVETELPNGPINPSIKDNVNTIADDYKNNQSLQSLQNRPFKVGDFIYLDSGLSSTSTITSSSSLKRQHNHNNLNSNNSSGNVDTKDTEPHIVLIERLFTGSGGKHMLYGSKYLRPAETYHVSTRRFLERELFKSDTHITAPINEVVGQCCVLSVKVYFTQRPSGFPDTDIYVLESRYSTRMRSFKKIKIFRDLNCHIKLEPREVPIEPKRVMSVFRERLEKHKDELQELQDCVEQQRVRIAPNVVAIENGDGLGNDTYYEQYTSDGVVLKTGDFVYVLNEGGRQTISHINTIWTSKDGKEFFRGPWFLPPSEVPPSPTRLFYKQEVFLSTVEDTNPLLSIVGKCSVLHYNEFIACRVTEVAEQDVYICTSMLDEVSRQVKRLPPDGMSKVKHCSPEVQEDEVYAFPRILNPPKKVNKTKLVTGYILYSRDVRKAVCVSNPDSNFGEISKIVGNDWRALPSTIKQTWEERAMRLNGEAKERDRQLQLSTEDGSNSPAPVPALPPPDQVFECLWDTCDFQFEELSDCVEHCIRDRDTGGGHVQSYYGQRGQDSDLNCMWRGCGRNNKKNVQPFPNMARLTRHVRDMHINKGNGRSIAPDIRSKNFKASSKVSSAGAVLGYLQQGSSNSSGGSLASPQQQQYTATSSQSAANASPLPCANAANGTISAISKQQPTQQQIQYEPMFISVPPRPQRALHSEAYIKYIEGLHAENKFISPWERTLTVTQQDVAEPAVDQAAVVSDNSDNQKLQHVMSWLGPQYQQNHQEHLVSALWSLRNQLLNDALALQNTL